VFNSAYSFIFNVILMNAYIVTIGNELLNGNTLDTNSSWLGRELDKFNINILGKITIPDNIKDIEETIKCIVEKSFDYVFVTGGLGPTHDDMTKTAIKNVLKTDEYFDEKYYEKLKLKFKKHNVEMLEQNKEQAVLLKKTQQIHNPLGTALGIEFLLNNSRIFVMPGVPNEMQEMMKEVIIPKHFSQNKNNTNNLIILTAGIPESIVADKINDLINEYVNEVKVAFLPKYSGVNIRLSLIDQSKSKHIDEMKNKIVNKLGSKIYGYDNDKIENVVGEYLNNNNLTLSIAESCTGGLLSKKITNSAGSSKYFVGSIVAYSDKIKEKKINVSKKLLKEYGAVSEEVVTSMALEIKKEFSSDIGFAISGISGPDGGSLEKPVGLVHMALAFKKEVYHKKFNFIPKRDIHREISAQVALNIIRIFLLKNQDEF